ncbi:hypothetical protein D1BOALGB6SA_7114 [Olavius sp. associated proteobacterium Delta 1]|nr:hypothetical protein D1BOALGB6SA_7114 [Olavius sp. associated proteobacterium Delta 1]
MHKNQRNNFFWLSIKKSKYKECGSGFQPRNQMPRLAFDELRRAEAAFLYITG